MNEIGFPPQPRQASLARQITELRSRISQTTREAVTGRLGDPAASRNGKIADLFAMQARLDRLGQYREMIDLSANRAALTQASLDQIRELAVATTASAQTALAANSKVPLGTVSLAARQNLAATVSALNASFAGRNLFSGDATDRGALLDSDSLRAQTDPLISGAADAATAYAALDTAFTSAGGLFETTLYTGGSGDAPAAEIADGERIAFAVRADDARLRPVLRDLVALSAAFDPTVMLPEPERAKLAELALDGLRNGVEGLAGLSAEVGTAEQRIDTVKTRNAAEDAALTISYNRVAGRDQAEAIAELKSLQGQLESLFITTTRIANLSLTQFLR